MKNFIRISIVLSVLYSCERFNKKSVEPIDNNRVDTIFNPFDSICRDTIISNNCNDTIIPNAIAIKIAFLEAKGDTASSLFVDQYCYRDTVYYLFYSECCDRYNYLLNTQGDTICIPSGGFTGGGNGSCPCFLDKATKIKTIWNK